MEAKEIYDGHADLWVRKAPILLSDYSARPHVIERCGNVHGLSVLDLGCGEGYVGRQIAMAGAASVMGYDVSGSMIRGANETAASMGLEHLTYQVSDLRKAEFGHKGEAVDLVIAVFLFNYMDTSAMTRILCRVREILKPGGRFIFTVPHPMLPWIDPNLAMCHLQFQRHWLTSRQSEQPKANLARWLCPRLCRTCSTFRFSLWWTQSRSLWEQTN